MVRGFFWDLDLSASDGTDGPFGVWLLKEISDNFEKQKEIQNCDKENYIRHDSSSFLVL